MIIPLLIATLFIGDHTQGEIEIVTDPIEVAAIEETQKQRLMKRGLSEAEAKESSRVGLVVEDIY